MPPSPYLQITTTCDERPALERLAERLIGERLVACAQISGPIQSHYRWEEKHESAQEWLLQAKTREELQPAVFALIRANHPYQVPQLTATRLEFVSAEYALWLDQSVKWP